MSGQLLVTLRKPPDVDNEGRQDLLSALLLAITNYVKFYSNSELGDIVMRNRVIHLKEDKEYGVYYAHICHNKKHKRIKKQKANIYIKKFHRLFSPLEVAKWNGNANAFKRFQKL